MFGHSKFLFYICNINKNKLLTIKNFSIMMTIILYSILLGIFFVSFLSNIAKASEKERLSYNIKGILQVAYLTAIFIYCLKENLSAIFLALSLPLILFDILFFIWDRWKNRNGNEGELITLSFTVLIQILVFLSWGL